MDRSTCNRTVALHVDATLVYVVTWLLCITATVVR